MQTAPDQEVAEKVADAVEALLQEDAFLLIANSNERSISHRLAVHLGIMFADWHVDCEYNRDNHSPKRLKLSSNCTTHSGQEDGSRVFPDIIIHRRNSNENFVVIELKKSTSSVPHGCDYEKLRQYCDELGYKHALFLDFLTGEDDVDVQEASWISGGTDS